MIPKIDQKVIEEYSNMELSAFMKNLNEVVEGKEYNLCHIASTIDGCNDKCPLRSFIREKDRGCINKYLSDKPEKYRLIIARNLLKRANAELQKRS